MIDKAYGGDIIGVFDPGIFSIGDTLTTSKERFVYEGIPTFAPEHFARVRQVDTMKRKQFVKGINQIAQEGAIQIFQEYNTGMEEIIVGVVGVLQFDVLKYRLENEYKVEIRLENLPYEYIRWIENEEIDMNRLVGTSDMKKIKDLKDRPLLLFTHEWSIRMTQERNEGLRRNGITGIYHTDHVSGSVPDRRFHSQPSGRDPGSGQRSNIPGLMTDA